MADTVATKYWHALDEERVQCDLCPRFCRLREGQRGLCFVRMCRDHQVVLTTYGRSSGFCVDPIEKKPLNHFYPGTSVLSFGTAGCNLACKFCQNWDISKSREIDTLADSAAPEAIARAAKRLGCMSVAYTYNDPVIFHEYAIDIAQACREQGVRSVAVSAGYVTAAPRAEFYRYMDAVNIDLKAFTEGFYRKLCGGSLASVLETLEYLRHETQVWLEITNLIIPGENDAEAEIDAMCAWVVDRLGNDVPIHFSAFHPDWKMRDKPPTSKAVLRRAWEIARANGIRYPYTGNVHDERGDSTLCHQCQAVVIGRNWYSLTSWQLDSSGRCKRCGAACAGCFDGPPGDWGRRRLPVRMAVN